MSIRVGPMVGVGVREARIWFEAAPDKEYTVEVHAAGQQWRTQSVRSDGNGLALARFDDLEANTCYTYTVKDNGGSDVTNVPDCRFTTLPNPGDETDLTFGFYSCHRPFYGDREKFEPESLKMWSEFDRQVNLGSIDDTRPQNIRFLMGVGDQVYTDRLWGKHSKKPRRRYKHLTEGELVEEYSKVYRKYLELPEVRKACAHCPVFFTWDDHEIRDGWGSHGDEQNDEKPERSALMDKFFRAASTAYDRYQLSHNPYVDPARGYYSFVYGKIGFIVLDLRRYRCLHKKELLGEAQRNWLESELAAMTASCEVVFVVCSVPYIHLTNQLTRLTGKWFVNTVLRFTGLRDDFIDQWNSEHCFADAMWLGERLFNLANEKGTRFVLLGGDVHVGTVAVLRSHLQEHEYHPLIYQFTSSAISNKPTWQAFLLKWFASEIELRKFFPFKGRMLKMMIERNFGLVEVRKHPQTGDWGITLSIHGEKSGVQRFPTVW